MKEEINKGCEVYEELMRYFSNIHNASAEITRQDFYNLVEYIRHKGKKK